MNKIESFWIHCAHSLRFVMSLILVVSAGAVQAIDLMPEDAIAPPKGLHALQLRSLDAHYQGAYVDGVKVDPSARLSAQGYAVRYAFATEVLNRPSVIYVDLPYGEVKSQLTGTQNAGKSTGDVSLAFAHWLLSDSNRQEFAGVVAYLILPSGEYDPKYTSDYVNTNLGQNRWAFALQAGYSKRVFGALTWLAAVDSVWFGKNDDFRPAGRSVSLEQRPLRSIQNHLSGRVTSTWMVGFGHIWNTNGEWVVDGIALGNRQNTHRIQLASTYDLPKGFRLGLQLSRALHTENGLHEKRDLTLRFWHFF
jgi:hypothetical protein